MVIVELSVEMEEGICTPSFTLGLGTDGNFEASPSFCPAFSAFPVSKLFSPLLSAGDFCEDDDIVDAPPLPVSLGGCFFPILTASSLSPAVP